MGDGDGGGEDAGGVLVTGVGDAGVVDAGAVLVGAGEAGDPGAPVLTAAPTGRLCVDNGPCADGAAVRAITSTRNASTMRATRSVWPPARPEVAGSDPARPRDGSSARGVDRTAGHRSESPARGGTTPEAESVQPPAVAVNVAQPA